MRIGEIGFAIAQRRAVERAYDAARRTQHGVASGDPDATRVVLGVRALF